MKKMIFCLQTMICGGVEKELITLLNKLDKKEYDITVLVMYIQDKQIVEMIPNHVQFINLGIDPDEYYSSTRKRITKKIRSGNLIGALRIAVKRVFRNAKSYDNSLVSQIPKINDSFDIAVCYHIHSILSLRYVADSIVADKKIAWIHSDLFKTHYPIDDLKPFLDKYNEVVSVSKRVKDEFDELMPDFQGESSFAHNVFNDADIIAKSDDSIEDCFFDDDICKILTVGRFSPEKGIDQAIECCRILKENRIDYRWYFIGWGEGEKLYRKMIKKYLLEDYVVILGRKENPYPYMKKCDIYCQPSRHEAWCLTLTEAKILCKPIICTDFAGADEQIENGKTGIIVPINNLKMLYEGIKKMIFDSALRQKLTDNLMDLSTNNNDWESIEKHFR